jgi:predicted NAD/FAD-dependent oxidoreductase
MTTIAIIGAGLAGAAAGRSLQEAGHQVTLFDKGRGPGGRMSTRRMETALGTVRLDHGAQFFTVRGEGLTKAVAGWTAAGACAPWSRSPALPSSTTCCRPAVGPWPPTTSRWPIGVGKRP